MVNNLFIESAEFFNKIMTNIRSCGEYYFSPENLKKRLVNTDENSVTLFLQAFLEKLDRDDFKFIRPAQDFADVSVRNL